MKLLTILMIGIVLFSVLYSPQVVYPVIMADFSASATDVALLQTAIFIPLTLSPIFYGMLIDRFSPLLVLRTALLLLSAGVFAFSISDSFHALLLSRFAQGLFLPAAMTGVVSYISTSYKNDSIQKNIAYYMASTMAGGVAGRVFAGFLSSLYGWNLSFLALSITVFISFMFSLTLPAPGTSASKQKNNFSSVFRQRELMTSVLTVFFAFIVFSSIMNFYSIRIKELVPDVGEFLIGLAYIGSLFGALTAYLTPKFSKLSGSYKNTIIYALSAMLLSLVMFQTDSVTITIAVLFLFCGAFIVVHTSCSGLINKFSSANKGAINGIYFTVYYFGGVIGSFMPGYIYESMGWSYFLSVLMLSAVFGMMLAFRINLEKMGEL